jgi:hypothetical protein
MFTIRFATENDAFYADFDGEVRAILDRVAADLSDFARWGAGGRSIRDSNGNRIGTVEYTPAAIPCTRCGGS